MEFFLFLLYNQENSREKYFPAKRGEINMKGTSCEYCANYTYDEECDEYYCDVNLDEDEYYRFVSTLTRNVRIIVPEMNIRWYVIRCDTE